MLLSQEPRPIKGDKVGILMEANLDLFYIIEGTMFSLQCSLTYSGNIFSDTPRKHILTIVLPGISEKVETLTCSYAGALKN